MVCSCSLLLQKIPWPFEHSVMLIGHLMWMTGAPPQGLPFFLVLTQSLGGLANKRLLPGLTEAEYCNIAQTSIGLTWIYTLLTELQVSFTTPVIFCDNQSVVSIAHNPVFHSRTKHMEIDVFFVREKILAKQLSIVHILVLDQWADILTKPLSASRFEAMRGKLNVKSVSNENSPS